MIARQILAIHEGEIQISQETTTSMPLDVWSSEFDIGIAFDIYYMFSDSDYIDTGNDFLGELSATSMKMELLGLLRRFYV